MTELEPLMQLEKKNNPKCMHIFYWY